MEQLAGAPDNGDRVTQLRAFLDDNKVGPTEVTPRPGPLEGRSCMLGWSVGKWILWMEL